MRPKPQIDLTTERKRMSEAAELRVCVERDWRRDSGGRLVGEWGRMMRREIEARFDGGDAVTVLGEDDVEIPTGARERWEQLSALIDLGFDPIGEVVEEQALLYREPVQIRGELGVHPVWTWLRARSGLDAALMRRQRIELALGSAIVRPIFHPWRAGIYHPPGLKVVPPDMCIAVADPTAPGRLNTYAERIIPDGANARDHWLAWDISDPAAPYWGRWETADAWASGRSPTWIMEGEDYPFWWQGMPLMPAVASRARVDAVETLPSMPGRAQGVKDLMIHRLWCVCYVPHVGSFSQLIIMSDVKVKGLSQLRLDPNVIGNVWSQGGGTPPALEVVPHSLDGAQILGEMHRARVQEWARGVNRSFQVRQASDAPKSGVALQIEMTGQVQAANEAETRCEPVDIEIVKALASAMNYLTRSGQIRLAIMPDGAPDWAPYRGSSGPQWSIPESSDIEIGYPRRWNEVERARQRAELVAAVAMGQESPRALWLFDHDLEDDRPHGPNWAAADEAITASLGDKARYASMGYGVAPERLWLKASVTPEDEAQLHIPPGDVANTASRGLNLRAANPGRGLPGGPGQTQGNFLRARAKRLQNQDPMTVGEVRSLHTWLAQHTDDGAHPSEAGTWGDDADPSAQWVEYLSQGGDAGLAWSETILAGPTTEPAPVPTDGP